MFSSVILTCALLVLIRPAAATNVGGIILQNTVWMKANNPYNITADVQVPRNVTLIIQAGVQIIFDELGDFEMLIKGYLQVQGTSGQRVVFNASATTNNTKWMLTFKAANLSQSSIVNVQFIGPKKSVALLEVLNGVPLNVGELKLQHCVFADTAINTYSTLFHQWTSLAVPTLVIQNSILTNSMISNGDFNSRPQLIKLIGDQLQNVTIKATAQNNGISIVDCRGGSVSVEWRPWYKAYFEINDTKLTNINIAKFGDSYADNCFTIRRSILLNSSILLAGLGGPYGTGEKVDIQASKLTVFKAVEMQHGSIQNSTITSFGNSSNTTGVYAGAVSIINSSIFNFNVGLSIFSYSKLMGSISNSNFYRNSRYNIVNMGNSDINATGNWWGTTTCISDTLYDYWKNINYGEIFYNNYALSRIGHED